MKISLFDLSKNFIRLRISLLTKSKISLQALACLVGPSGLEPPTSCLSGTRSNLLSYEPLWLVSDLSHLNSCLAARPSGLVEMMGFDSRRGLRGLVADGSNNRLGCYSLPSLFESNSVRVFFEYPHYFHGGDDGIRTHDPLLAGQVLSQLSYTPINEVCLLRFIC